MQTLESQIIDYLTEHRGSTGSSVEAIVYGIYGARDVNKANLWHLSAQIYFALLGMSEAININPLPELALEDRINASRWKLKE